ncbi:MAG: PAS domain-containing protein [Alphaproteobacteria bacterium]|nr:PAS domain-containing protein [Alphaproteobacteria bacterium]
MITLGDCAASLQDAPNRLALLQAWIGWRGDGLFPMVDAVKPEDIGSALSCMMVLEAKARDKIMIRLAGTQFHQILGREITGENFVDLAAPHQRETRMEHYSNYVSYPCGAKWSADIVKSNGNHTSVQGIVLPVGPREPGNSMRMYAAMDFTNDTKGSRDETLSMIPPARDITYLDIGCGAPE